MDFAILTATTSAMGASSSKESLFFWILILAGIATLIFSLQWIMTARSTVANTKNVASTLALQTAIFQTKFASEFKDKKTLLQAIREQSVAENENCLINFQPLTVIHPGFLGPIRNGVYNEKEGVATAIRMGARCFVLPIDYHTKETMGITFPPPNKPCLLFRDEGGTVRSINGGSIAKVAQAIADVAWSNAVNQRNDPFLLVLYFMRTPEEGTKEYLDFLSQVATDLTPLSPYLLGQTPEGVYNRQARQDQLLFINTDQLEKKLLVFCNVDTSGFRTAKKDFNKTYLPKEDLDYWVHMRIFKQNTETPLGATTVPERATVPRSLLETVSYYTTLPSDANNKRNAITGTKEKFMITLSGQGKNPEVQSAITALDTYGVQCVPLLITDYSEEVKSLLAQWKYAWRAKPKGLRYVRPAPIAIQTQSTATNANGGRITIPA
jgi:hypothetical protein